MDSTHAYNFWTLGHPQFKLAIIAFEFVFDSMLPRALEGEALGAKH